MATTADAADSTAASPPLGAPDEELQRQTMFGALLVNMGVASEEEVFGSTDSALMQACRERRLKELLVINRPQDDAAAHPFLWSKPWTWWGSGVQVSPLVYRQVAPTSSASAPRLPSQTLVNDSTQTEDSMVPPSKAPPLPRKKGLPPVDVRALTPEEEATLTHAVREERAKLLRSEERVHERLQEIEDTRYRYLVPSRDVKCEAEVAAVVRCYAERNRSAAVAIAARQSSEGSGREIPNGMPSSVVKTSIDSSGLAKETTAVRADLLACGPHVQRLKTCADAMVMAYNHDGEAV